MPVNSEWLDDTHRTLIYRASGQWDWNDYHRAVQMSLMNLSGGGQPVDVLVDLSVARQLPRGAVAHLRSIGKPEHPRFSGRAIVIGVNAELAKQLSGSQPTRQLQMRDHVLYLVDTWEEALAQLRAWQSDAD